MPINPPFEFQFQLFLKKARSRKRVNELSKSVRSLLLPLRRHHPDTYAQSPRVAILCAELAEANHLSDQLVSTLTLAGLLHDIGKCDVPVVLLDKKSKLSPEEFRIVMEHPRYGFARLKDESRFDLVRRIVVGHHEFGRHPYPRSGGDRRTRPRVGQQRRTYDQRVSRLAQMLAITDMFEALASRRSYKEPLSDHEIELLLSGQFNGNRKYVEQLLCLTLSSP